MPSLFVISILGFALALIFTPLVRAAARRWPPRPRHSGPMDARSPVPRLGGLAVALATVLAIAGTRLAGWRSVGTGLPSYPWTGPVLLVLLVGAMDDRWDLRPRWKFLGQGLAAVWAMAAGLRIHHLFHVVLPLPVSVAVTLLWLVGCCNAFNLIDGLDGLAAGLALFATGTVLAHAVLIGEPELAVAMGAVFGALGGFLVFNFPPASIYLGDSGSLAIGFFLGCMALTWANKATTAVGLLAPVFAMLIPLADATLAMLRRALTGHPLFEGDRRHVHHQLLGKGFSPRAAVLVLYAAAGAGAVAALVLADLRQRQTYELVILMFVAMAAVGLHQLGYVEVFQAGAVWARTTARRRRNMHARVLLQQCAQELDSAPDLEAVWERLVATCRALEFDGVSLESGSFRRCAGAEPGMGFRGWTCRLPLGEDGSMGRVTIWRGLDGGSPGFFEDLAAALQNSLEPRLQALRPAAEAARAKGAGA